MKLMFLNVLMNSSQWLQMLPSSLDFAPIAAPGTDVIGCCCVRMSLAALCPHLFQQDSLVSGTSST
ncbi:hypothetical protein OUZ56_029012 [Daphnia magna]|uniref:Secreted protein n=1 Tax=Daphnia magna TaxID=35525 RepID=A0ABR0B5J7_9CRUS|nr:hypothetical protein OUZ56_029012 [Daphnia magna]